MAGRKSPTKERGLLLSSEYYELMKDPSTPFWAAGILGKLYTNSIDKVDVANTLERILKTIDADIKAEIDTGPGEPAFIDFDGTRYTWAEWMSATANIPEGATSNGPACSCADHRAAGFARH